MLSSAAQRLFLTQLVVLGVAAHRDWWLQGLPDCWQNCLGSTEDGCNSRNCVCKTTEVSASYLPSAVSCAVSTCDADDWALELVLGPLQLHCAAIDCSIPDDVMDSAYAAATDTNESTSSTSREAQSTTKTKAPEHTSTEGGDSGEALTSSISTTITKTTTDGDGNTLQVLVPIVMGPTGISTGSVVTSTVDASTSSAGTPSSAPASRSPAQDSSPAPTRGSTSTSTSPTGSRETEAPANGNGSPFENMQAGAGKWSVSAPLLGLGAFAGVFMLL